MLPSAHQSTVPVAAKHTQRGTLLPRYRRAMRASPLVRRSVLGDKLMSGRVRLVRPSVRLFASIYQLWLQPSSRLLRLLVVEMLLADDCITRPQKNRWLMVDATCMYVALSTIGRLRPFFG